MVTWTSVSSTIALADYPGVLDISTGTMHAPYTIQQAFGGEDPYGDAAARACAFYWACYGGVSFGSAWLGSCPTEPNDGYIPDANSWSNYGGFGSQVYSVHDTGQITVPASYGVGVTQAFAYFNIDVQDSGLVGLFAQESPGIVEVQVLSATLTVAFNPNTTLGFLGSGWAAIIRSPVRWNSHPTWIDPGELGSFPQIGSMAPGGSTSVTLPLTGTSRYFGAPVYLKSSTSENSNQDLGLEYNEYGNWLPEGVSLTLGWQYRTTDTTPGAPLSIDELDREARAYFEP